MSGFDRKILLQRVAGSIPVAGRILRSTASAFKSVPGQRHRNRGAKTTFAGRARRKWRPTWRPAARRHSSRPTQLNAAAGSWPRGPRPRMPCAARRRFRDQRFAPPADIVVEERPGMASFFSSRETRQLAVPIPQLRPPARAEVLATLAFPACPVPWPATRGQRRRPPGSRIGLQSEPRLHLARLPVSVGDLLRLACPAERPSTVLPSRRSPRSGNPARSRNCRAISST